MSLNHKSKQRRRDILKAAVGAPVIFTLPTGAALAAASLTCKDKSKTQAQQNPPKGVVAASDTWMRYQVTGKSIEVTIPDGTKIVKGFTLDNKWYKVNVGTGPNSGNVVLLDSATIVNMPPPDNGQFYYLLVDHTKYETSSPFSPQNFVFLGSTAIEAPIAGHSCWNSISTVNNNLPGNVVN